jgi:hypothetical protein
MQREMVRRCIRPGNFFDHPQLLNFATVAASTSRSVNPIDVGSRASGDRSKMEHLRVPSAIGLFKQVQAAFTAGILVRHDILVTAGERYANSVYWEPRGVYTNAPTS